MSLEQLSTQAIIEKVVGRIRYLDFIQNSILQYKAERKVSAVDNLQLHSHLHKLNKG